MAKEGTKVSNLAPLLERNKSFAKSGIWRNTPSLPFLPFTGLYIITCIDPRTDPADFLGLDFGEAIVGRTVGGRVTDAVIQDLSYIGYLVETRHPKARTSRRLSSTTPTAAAGCWRTRNCGTASPSVPDTTSRCWQAFRLPSPLKPPGPTSPR
jgi:hypothetical protein